MPAATGDRVGDGLRGKDGRAEMKGLEAAGESLPELPDKTERIARGMGYDTALRPPLVDKGR